jgi:hypothetical protein
MSRSDGALEERLSLSHSGFFVVSAIQQAGRAWVLLNDCHTGSKAGLRRPHNSDGSMIVDIFQAPG